MKLNRKLYSAGAVIMLSGFTIRAFAQPFDLSWHTIDGGGGMNSTGAAFLLSGTIGQCDAQTPPVMSGGSFQLIGGFWAVPIDVCTCPGDVNSDALRNGRDIQTFVQCVIGAPGCDCADIDAVPGVNMGDVTVFVGDMLTGAQCP